MNWLTSSDAASATASFVSLAALMMWRQKCNRDANPFSRAKIYPPPTSFEPNRTGIFCTSELNGCVDIAVEKSGANSLKPQTVVEFFRKCVEEHHSRVALAVKRKQNGVLPDQWRTWTFMEYYVESLLFAKALHSLGVEQYAAVNILGFNSPEWFIANMGATMGGAIPAGIYSTNSSDACHYISEHSQANVIALDGLEQLSKYIHSSNKSKALPHLKAIVVWGVEDIAKELRDGQSFAVYTWDEFLKLGFGVDTKVVYERSDRIKAGECASLIYTSGTTGTPKAVMLSHDNITWTCQIFAREYVVDGMKPGRLVSYLPLSHIAAQMIDIHYGYYAGNCVYFAQPDALKGSLSVTLKEVRPSVFFGVPRVWEKMEDKLKEMGKQSTGIKKLLASWAKGLGFQHCMMAQYGASGSTPWGYTLARLLVLKKIEEALGFDQCRAFFTAAAPIGVDTLHYFASLDIPVYELFGQSESTGPHTSSRFGQWKFGFCGRPLPGTYTKIDDETNELCYRGRHIFMGYAHGPEETKRSFDAQGYLRSGDVAEFDENDLEDVPRPSGFMKITGRIKDLIITAGGENIPPTLIEMEMKLALPAVSNCVVIGDKRRYLAMLLTLKCEVDPESGEPTDKLSAEALSEGKSIGSDCTLVSEAAVDKKWVAYINSGMRAANEHTTSRAQVVQKWRLLPRDLSEKQGLLTPTLKIKRNVVNATYSDVIESMYADDANSPVSYN